MWFWHLYRGRALKMGKDQVSKLQTALVIMCKLLSGGLPDHKMRSYFENLLITVKSGA